MASIRTYQDLEVWQKGMDLAEGCYRITRSFPTEEKYGLTSQIRRAAVSVPANIAEGYGREYRAEFIQFLRIAQGSLKELETHLLLSIRVEILDKLETQPLLDICKSVSRMLRAFIRSLQAKG